MLKIIRLMTVDGLSKKKLSVSSILGMFDLRNSVDLSRRSISLLHL